MIRPKQPTPPSPEEERGVMTEREKDRLLRDHGFQIHSRPKDRQASWTRNGHTYTEDEALSVARQERAKALKKLEDAHGG